MVVAVDAQEQGRVDIAFGQGLANIAQCESRAGGAAGDGVYADIGAVRAEPGCDALGNFLGYLNATIGFLRELFVEAEAELQAQCLGCIT